MRMGTPASLQPQLQPAERHETPEPAFTLYPPHRRNCRISFLYMVQGNLEEVKTNLSKSRDDTRVPFFSFQLFQSWKKTLISKTTIALAQKRL
jgi:hypothetical protein